MAEPEPLLPAAGQAKAGPAASWRVAADDVPAPQPAASPQGGKVADGDKVADPDDGQEVDVWWGCYAARTMLPSFAVCGVLTVLIGVGAWYLWWHDHVDPLVARYGAYALVAGVWFCQFVRGGYRAVLLNYRLTTRRLFLERWFLHSPFTAIDLRRVATVVVERTPLERRLNVGTIRLLDEGAPSPLAILRGVYQPEVVAAEIRARALRARARAGS